MSQYLVLPHLDIRNANAQPAWWMIGPPAITAYLGFAHALANKIRAGAHAGIAIIHHDIQFLGETFWDYGTSTLLPHQFRSASFIDKADYSDKNKHALSAQPTARCHIKVSLVIRFEDEAVFGLSDANTALRGGRVAGGDIVAHGDPAYFEGSETPPELVRQIGSGFSIISRQDLMTLEDGDRDMLDALLRVTRPRRHGSTASDGQSWILPTTLGYTEITAREQRHNVRGGFPHAYAEPLVGLIQYRAHREAGLHFWRYQHPTSHTFVASTD